MFGAKKLIYEVNKLLCQQSRKEYGQGIDFKIYCFDHDPDLYKSSGLDWLQLIVANRYIIFLTNSSPTLISKEAVMVYFEDLKDGGKSGSLNRLEHSVWQGYLNETTIAELWAFSIMHLFVCQPLLSRAKSAKNPLDINFFYQTPIRRLASYDENSQVLLDEDFNIWGGSVKETEPHRPCMLHIQALAKQQKEKVLYTHMQWVTGQTVYLYN